MKTGAEYVTSSTWAKMALPNMRWKLSDGCVVAALKTGGGWIKSNFSLKVFHQLIKEGKLVESSND